jgi:hypothetical protein
LDCINNDPEVYINLTTANVGSAKEESEEEDGDSPRPHNLVVFIRYLLTEEVVSWITCLAMSSVHT